MLCSLCFTGNYRDMPFHAISSKQPKKKHVYQGGKHKKSRYTV